MKEKVKPLVLRHLNIIYLNGKTKPLKRLLNDPYIQHLFSTGHLIRGAGCILKGLDFDIFYERYFLDEEVQDCR